MAEIIVNYLVERLLELGRDYVEQIAGVEENVEDLRRSLEELQAFLKEASKFNRDDNEAWQQALKEIRTIVYKAEDDIEKFVLEAKKHQLLNQVMRLADAPYLKALWKISGQIKAVQKRVKDVREKNLKLFDDSKSGSLSHTATSQHIEHTVSEDDDVVGLEKATDAVIERLLGGSKTTVEAVPIFGMTGLGKSTLARKVVKHPKIEYGFFAHIWVNVTEKYTKKEVLRKILLHFTKQTNENMTDEELIDEIHSFLEVSGRCLIVLDDVWDKNVRDVVQLVFPTKNVKGHRIMVTTRQRVAAAAFSEDIYEQDYLSDADSWLLLKKKVFKRDTCSGDLEEPGFSIAKKCAGLPLSVVVIAGALIDRKTRMEWEQVDRNIAAHLLNKNSLQDSCLEFVRMSYDRLPYATKACFLYCATFPRGFEIPAWKLIRLWIAEGFIPFVKELSPEEQAESCLSDLTKKSLVIVMSRKSNGQIKTCRIHDMLYEFCRKVAKEQDLFEEATTARDQPSVLSPVSNICRRLCIDSSILGNPSLFRKKKTMESVRSLLCFSSKQTDKPQASMKTIDKAFPLIKVLELESVELGLSNGFYQLLNLRYVSFSGNFNLLPPNFGKFWNLETLIIHTTTRESTIDVKADIWSMPRLRHLHSNVPAKLPSPSSASRDEGCCIQSLSTIAPESCTNVVCATASSIRKLGIKGDVVAQLLETSSGVLSHLEKLEHLKLVNDDLDNTKAVTLPNLVVVFPKTLRKLTFFGTRLKWSEMSKLAQLESLEVLKLKEYAFQGEVWEPEIGGFCSLTVLWIDRTDLKTWHASNRNFPILKRLVLKSCDKLEGIPESLVDIPDLEEMKLESTHIAAVKSAKMIEQKKLERRSSNSVAFKLSVVLPTGTDAESKSPQ